MKRIGILTFHRANNHGAVLQCYALQTYLIKKGCSVEIIDYRQKAVERAYNTFCSTNLYRNTSHPQYIFRYIKGIFTRYIYNKKFGKFRNKFFNLSPVFEKNETLDYDVVIHGSDQIWNPKLTGHELDTVYLGFYKLKEGGKKITYGISFENKPIDSKASDAYKEGIKNFDSISLREKSLIPLLQPLTSKKIGCVVDPTLLLSVNDYNDIAEDIKERQHYVLVYTVGPRNLALKIAGRIAKERNLRIIDITHKIMTPNKFVGYFKNADFVVSVSFHGTIFSLLYKKNFYTIATGQASDVRYYDLLDKFNLSGRCVDRMPQCITDVDYSDFNRYKVEYIEKSEEYLQLNI